MKYYFFLFFLLFIGCRKEKKIKYYNTPIKVENEFDYSIRKNKYPIWILGLHIWEDNGNNSKSVNYIIDEYEKYNISFSSIIFDSPWSFSYNDFEIDTIRYPDFKELISKLNYKGKKKIFWLTGFHNLKSTDALLQKSPFFEYYNQKNYFVNNGSVFNWWKGTGAFVDFTNTMALNHFYTLMSKLDADGFKLDEGYSYLDDYVATSLGTISKEKLGHYYYSNLTTLLLSSNKVTLGRSFSSQGNPYLHSLPDEVTFSWSGDHRGDFQGLSEQLYDVLKSISYKHNLICWEVGGYNFPAPTKIDLLNSLKIGILLPSLNNGGRNGGLTNHLPWYHDQETIEIFRKYIDIHYNLIPYFYSELINNGKERLLSLDNFSKNSYYIGEYLQVFTPTNSLKTIECNFQYPKNWYNFFSSEKINDEKLIFNNSLENIPLFVKRGAILPFYNPFLNNSNKIKFYIFPFEKNEYIFHVPDVHNKTFLDIVSVNYDVLTQTLEYKSNYIHNFEFVIMSKNNISLLSKNINTKILHNNNSSVIQTTGKNEKFNLLNLNNY